MNNEGVKVGDASAEVKSNAGDTFVIAGLMLAVFLGMLDQQIVATALPQIVGDLGGLAQFGWITTAYIIASSVTVPIYGKFGDLFGRKKIILIAIIVFMLGSVASGLAPNIGFLIGARAFQGLGSGGLFVTSFSIIGERFGAREGAKYYGYFSMCFAGAALAGPFVGGVLTQLLSWRWVFFFNLPFGLAALLIIARHLRLPSAPRKPNIDYLGILLLSALIICLTLMTSWGGTRYPWGAPVIIVLAVTSVLLLALFVRTIRRAADPVIPPRLFRNATFSLCAVLGIIAGAVFLGSVNFLALFLQVVTQATPAVSGLLLLPMMLGLVLSSSLTSKITARTGRYKWFPVASMALGIVSALLFSTMDQNTSRYVAVAYMFLFGIAAGLNIQVLATAAQATADRKDIGSVSATVTFSRSIGTAFGISIFASVFYGSLTRELAKDVPHGALAKFSENSLSSRNVLELLPPGVLRGVETAYAHALTPVFLTSAGLLAAGLVLSLLLKDNRLQREEQSPSSDED
jgi:EmrB/QacA subfamily drug resistance transporter